jgi:RNA polymerase sigma-70 factor (ECF subfamily)
MKANPPAPDHTTDPDVGTAGLFADLLRRVRAGDDQAAVELVRRHEAAVRLEVRRRLRDLRLRRAVDSLDICQSVFATFFLRAAAGQYDLGQPAQLVKLLISIARNKVAYLARKERAQRRDGRRVEPANLDGLEAGSPSPSQLVAGADLLREFRRRLTAEEERLADLRAQGRSWAEIAAELGGTPQARRMQWTRTVGRVARQLRLEETSHA